MHLPGRWRTRVSWLGQNTHVRSAHGDLVSTCGWKAIARCALDGTTDKDETLTEDLFDVTGWRRSSLYMQKPDRTWTRQHNRDTHESYITAWPHAVSRVPLVEQYPGGSDDKSQVYKRLREHKTIIVRFWVLKQTLHSHIMQILSVHDHLRKYDLRAK